MLTKVRQHLALLVSFALVVACIPAAALADTVQDMIAGEPETAPILRYRTHTMGADAWKEEEGWQQYKDPAEEQPQPEAFQDEEQMPALPLDSVEIRLSDDSEGVSYKIRDALGNWSEDWKSDGDLAFAEQGMSGIQVKLSDELDATYDVWYRAQVAQTETAQNDQSDQSDEVAVGVQTDGDTQNELSSEDAEVEAPEVPEESATADPSEETDGWLGWVMGDGELVSADNRPLVALEIALVAEGAGYPGQIVEQGADEESSEIDEEPSATSPAETPIQTTQSEAAAETPVTSVAAEASSEPSVEYRVHVQTYGWRNWVKDGAQAGTTGQAKRLEGLYIHLNNASGGIETQAHVQTYGWQNWVSSNQLAGTTGRAKRLEAIKLRLTGSIANSYDVWYRVHVQTYGWMSWVKNGELAGTTGQAKRLEALEVVLVRKGGTIPNTAGTAYEDKSAGSSLGVHYQSHVQTYGWMAEADNGRTSGTSGQAKRLEALRVKATGIDGGIQYRAHVQTYGWQGWVGNGGVAGTTGLAKRMEAIQIQLTGNAEKTYDVYYRTHVQTYGWQRWVKNGQTSGTTGLAKRMEAIQIIIQKKGLPAPVGNSETQLHGVDISGWDAGINVTALDADFVIIKATEGVHGIIYNTSYKTWANQALASGKLIGFYHYANGGDPIKEAESFYYAIKDYKGRAIACLDWEGQYNPKFNQNGDVEWCEQFLNRLKQLYGGKPFIYMSKSVTQERSWAKVAKSYPLWGAQYPDYNNIYGYQSDPWQSSTSWGPWGAKPTIFQYTSQGVLQNNGGISHFDFDLFYGTRANWASYMR